MSLSPREGCRLHENIESPIYQVEAVDLTHDAFGVCKLEDGYTVFVEDLLKGEKAEIIITERRSSFAFGKVVNLIEKSPFRVAPKCAHFYECGGCGLMHMDYPLQLAFKKYRIETTLKRAGLGHVEVMDTIGMAIPYHYRNKIEVKFQNGEKGIEAGFFQAKSHRLVNLQECHIMSKKTMDVITLLKNIFNELKISAYDERTKHGLIHSAVIRESSKTRQMNVLLHTTGPLLEHKDIIIKKLTAKIPELVGVARTNATDPSSLASDPIDIWFGKDILMDAIGDLQFSIGYRSFYQVNAIQTEKLYAKAIEYAELTGKERVIDAYSGIGTIALSVARKVSKVFGIEIVKSAVTDARKNAELNQINNAFFEVGEAESVIKKWAKYKFDCIFVDPPRKGVDKALIQSIIDMKIPRIVYVSCDPATLVRDLKSFSEGGYIVKEITPVDMFPQSTSIESVTLLTLKQ